MSTTTAGAARPGGTSTAGDAATAGGARRYPALDGLRGLAVAGVVAYHLGAPWLGGGYLGVDLFFVLSGFLITGLLLDERRRSGAVRLGAFWARRARRLLPGLLALLVVVMAVAATGALPVMDPGALRADVLATLAYVANWHQLWAGQSYFAQFTAPSPLAHAWSLAIEEQFYVVWPLAVAAMAALGARRRARAFAVDARAGRPGRVVFAVAALGGLASAAWMGWLAAHGAPADRLYYGTDTRAFDLLAGAALAAALAGRPEPGPRARRATQWAGLAGAGVLAWAWVSAGAGGDGNPPRWVFEGGMALCALAALAVLGEARLARPGLLGKALAAPPLRFLGRISYAVYLWHWPVIVALTPARTGLAGAPLQLLRLAAIGAAAISSTLLLEEPLRRGARRAATVPPPARPRLGSLLGAGATGVLVVGLLTTALPAAASAAVAGPAPPASCAPRPPPPCG